MSSSTDPMNIKTLPGSEIEVRASIEPVEWEKERKHAVESLNKEVALDGFRKGHIPESVLVQRLGEHALLEEMAELAISRAYAGLIHGKRIRPIGRPKIELLKLAKGNPLEFRLTTAVIPEIKLPDYKALAKKNGSLEDATVTDKEIEETVSRILEMRAREGAEKEGKELQKDTPLPILTDEYAKTLGNFQTAQEFKARLKEEITREKSGKAKDKRRSAILDAIVAKTTVDLPTILLEGEANRMKEQLKADIVRVGGTWDEYLTHAKKTEEEFLNSLRPDAKKRAILQLAIDTIGEKESILPTDEDVERHVEALTKAYPDVSKEKAEDYVRYTETNRLVIEFLEKTAEEK